MKRTFNLLMVLSILFAFATKANAQNDYIDIPSTAASPGVYYLGSCSYSEPNPNLALGLDNDATLQLFARMPRSKMRKYKESQIVGVRIAVLEMIDVDVFLKKEINTEFITTKKATLFPGWNEVYFDEAQDIIDQSMCFGYQHLVKSSGEEVPQYRAIYAVDGKKEVATQDGFYWQANTKDPESYAKKYGNLMVQLIVSNPPSFTQNIAELDYLVMPNVKDEDGTSTFKVALQNIGSNPIDNYTLAYAINDQHVSDVQVTGALKEQSTRVLTVKGVKAEKGDVLKVNLKSINGVDCTEENSITGLFDMAEKSFPKKVLFEHFTTEKCGNCPKADKLIHSLLDNKYKDDFVWAAHHVGFYTDFLTLPESEDLLFLYGDEGTFCPALSLNRKSLFEDVAHPAISVPRDEEFLEMMLIASLEAPAPLGITVKATYNTESNEITAHINGEIEPADVDADNCVLNVWILEDDIQPQKQAGGDASFRHNNVIRYMNNGAGGTYLNIGSDDKFSETVTIPYDDSWNMDRVRVVAFVSRPIDDANNNVRVYNTDETVPTETQGIEMIGADTELTFKVVGRQILAQGVSSTDIQVRTLDGKIVENRNLLPGVYVAKVNNAVVQKVVVK